MKKLIFVWLLIFAFSLSCFAQETPQLLAVKTEKGMAVVYNNADKTFAFEIVGKDIKKADANPAGLFLVVDSKILQITFPKIKDILGEEKITDEKLILKKHQKWEIDFQSESVFKKQISVENEATKLLLLEKGKLQQTFFWTYKRPETDEKSEYGSDAFQSTLIGDTVFVIGSPFAKDEDLIERRQYFNQTLSSLVFFDKPISAALPKPPAKTPVKPKTSNKTKRKN